MIKRYDDIFLCLNPEKPDWFVSFEKAIASIRQMDGQNSIEDIVNFLVQKYELPRDEILEDLESLIELLEKMKMLESSSSKFNYSPPEISLEMAWMHITHRCNLRCKYCYITAGQAMENELTTEEIFDFIDQFHAMGGQNQTLALSGGEPLVREDFWEIVDYIRSKGIALIMATNGILVDEEVAKKIAQNFCGVQVSLDGPKEMHDAMRGKGSYDKAIKALHNLRNAGITPYINAVVTNTNYDKLGHLVQVAEELGLASIKSPPLMSIGKGEDSSQPSLAQLAKAWWAIENASRELNSDIPLDSKKNASEPLISLHGLHCGAAVNSISLDSNGSIYPCQAAQHPEFLAGNIRETSLQEIWDTAQVFQEWRGNTVNKIEGCSDCDWRNYCGGGCRMHAYASHGTTRAPDRYCEMHKRMYEESIWTSTLLKLDREMDTDKRWQKIVDDFDAIDNNES